jgi:hypothetical protein
MSKVVLFAASLLLVAGIATAGIINPCNSPVVYTGATPGCYFACPQGDTDSFMAQGFSFAFTINDLLGLPIANIPAADFWLIDCDPAKNLLLCAGSASSNADSATNALGKTTMSIGSLRVGGCADGFSVVCQGFILQQAPGCLDYCFNVKVRSCDIAGAGGANGDLVMDLLDLSRFATYYPPNVYNTCGDFNCNGLVNLQDLSRFAFHYGPPGHKCF